MNVLNDNVSFYNSAFKGYGAYILLWVFTIFFMKELTIVTIIWFFVYLFLTLKGVYGLIVGKGGHKEQIDRHYNQCFNEILFNVIGCVIVAIGYFIIISHYSLEI